MNVSSVPSEPFGLELVLALLARSARVGVGGAIYDHLLALLRDAADRTVGVHQMQRIEAEVHELSQIARPHAGHDTSGVGDRRRVSAPATSCAICSQLGLAASG